jgi:hypothetical protein
MKQVILTESQFCVLIETNAIIESIFEFNSMLEFKNKIKKYIKKMLLAGVSVATLTTMINHYCNSNNIPDESKKEVLSMLNDLSGYGMFRFSDWALVDNKTIATVYNAIPSQCNDDFGNTASMFRLDLNNILSHRIIAMERTFMKELGLKYGDVVFVEGTGVYDGVWQIQDTMNKRFAGQHKIDILVPNNIKSGQWNNVKLYVLKDKSLTDNYRSDMAPQVSREESKRQMEQKKAELKRNK